MSTLKLILKTDLGSSHEKDWRRIKEERNRNIPLLYLLQCQVTAPRLLRHTTPESLEQGGVQRPKLDFLVLCFSRQNSIQLGKKSGLYYRISLYYASNWWMKTCWIPSLVLLSLDVWCLSTECTCMLLMDVNLSTYEMLPKIESLQ